MIKETYSTFEFSYPKQWKDKANLADPYGKILYKDEKYLLEKMSTYLNMILQTLRNFLPMFLQKLVCTK